LSVQRVPRCAHDHSTFVDGCGAWLPLAAEPLVGIVLPL
jgi:hypothetical protein